MNRQQQQDAYAALCSRGAQKDDGRTPFSVEVTKDRRTTNTKERLMFGAGRESLRSEKGMNTLQQEEIFGASLRKSPDPYDEAPERAAAVQAKKKTREYEKKIKNDEHKVLAFNARAFTNSPKHGARAVRAIKKYSPQQREETLKQERIQLKFNAEALSPFARVVLLFTLPRLIRALLGPTYCTLAPPAMHQVFASCYR